VSRGAQTITSEAQKARDATRMYIIRKMRHMLLCRGVPPESVDDRLGWDSGRTRAIVRGWPARPTRKLKRKRAHRFVNDVTLDRMSDIALACGCEFDIALEPHT
jgi:hypothetical protein